MDIDCQADTDTLNDAGGNNGVWAVGAEEGDGVEVGTRAPDGNNRNKEEEQSGSPK